MSQKNLFYFTISGYVFQIKSFLDVFITRDKNNIETKVHRKSTNNNIYFNWTSHAPSKSKMSTLQKLVRRAYDICLTNEHLQSELSHIKKVFMNKINTHSG